MRATYKGLDMLRGLGIFVLLWMHTAFYYFDGLFDLDFNNPPPIVTIIGLLLMFAGIFGMISGTAHVVQYQRKTVGKGVSAGSLLRYNTVNALLMLAVAWLYFVFTGPGLADMANRSMNNSLLVELVRNGRWAGFNLERFLYVDSLVMIGMNLLLLGPIYLFLRKRSATLWLIAGLGFLALSLLRIPLYARYLDAVDAGQTAVVLLLNWLVNKNNPILPYLSFGLLGGWIGRVLADGDFRRMVRRIVPVGAGLFVLGAVLYVLLPDTMLERSIDAKWFAIMTAQLGLFPLLILFALWLFDFRKGQSHPEGRLAGPLAFLHRFGVAGLTAFFFESVLSAAVFRLLRLFLPSLHFGLGGALLYGFCLALLWGVLLWLWERAQYRYGIEWLLCRLLRPFGHSAKQDKLMVRS